MFTKNYTESYTTYYGKNLYSFETSLGKDKPNTELSFTSIKQEAEHFIYSNNKLSFDLLQEGKYFVCKFTRCKQLLDVYGECLQKSLLYSTQIQK